MVRFSKFFLPLYLFALLLFSCQEGREAGSLFGQWKQSGYDNRYISFSGSVVWLNGCQDGNIFGNFQHCGDSLFMQCYSITPSPADTILVEDIFEFRPINNIRLKIECLNDDALVLSKENQTWSFRKY